MKIRAEQSSEVGEYLPLHPMACQAMEAYL